MMASKIYRNQDSEARKQSLEYYLSRNINSFHSTFHPQLSYARGLLEFYRAVEYLSTEFVNYTLGSYSIHGDPLVKPLDAITASSEYIRIERCLYRFEIFCQIFCSAHFTSAEEEEAVMRGYLSHFSPWEHEQFATICDFMTRVLRSEQCHNKRMEVIISPETTARTPPPHPITYHISRGLTHILNVLDGEDWIGEDWTIAIAPNGMILVPSLTLLYDHLRRVMPDDSTLLGALPQDLEPEEQSAIIPQEWCPDADTGPADIWWLA
ncbi:hypothetical protein PoHVEF18_004513 [Penicillium ochrochloron]